MNSISKVDDKVDAENIKNINSIGKDGERMIMNKRKQKANKNRKIVFSLLQECEYVDETFNDMSIDTSQPSYFDVKLGQSKSNTPLLTDDNILNYLSKEGEPLRTLTKYYGNKIGQQGCKQGNFDFVCRI